MAATGDQHERSVYSIFISCFNSKALADVTEPHCCYSCCFDLSSVLVAFPISKFSTLRRCCLRLLAFEKRQPPAADRPAKISIGTKLKAFWGAAGDGKQSKLANISTVMRDDDISLGERCCFRLALFKGCCQAHSVMSKRKLRGLKNVQKVIKNINVTLTYLLTIT